MKNLLFLAAALSVFACEKAELPKPFVPVPGGASNMVSVSMGPNYENTLYFDLESRSVVKTVDRSGWDLAFSYDGSMIMLNTGKVMSVAYTTATEMSGITSASGAVWNYDRPSGEPDSLAMNNWQLNKVYLLDRGVNSAGTQLGKVKFRITAQTANSYTVEWSKISATSGFNSATVQKDPSKNFVCFSMNGTGETVDVEPGKADWDISFGSYTHVYPDGMPYLVNGVLTNRNQVRAMQVTTDAWEAIDLAKAGSYAYPSVLNAIGFDWKTYNFETELYVVSFEKRYVIQSVEGDYYKLRFLDFYDSNGVKGAPSFELVKL